MYAVNRQRPIVAVDLVHVQEADRRHGLVVDLHILNDRHAHIEVVRFVVHAVDHIDRPAVVLPSLVAVRAVVRRTVCARVDLEVGHTARTVQYALEVDHINQVHRFNRAVDQFRTTIM